ncbi:MAG: FAD-binding protein [Oscillospiraceae bacterium]|nr:FAD-binding protein [Oscillospiraceae bacterium]
MIQISNIPLPIDGTTEDLERAAARMLGISSRQIGSFAIARKSIDARKKSNVHYVCTVTFATAQEAALVSKAASRHISLVAPANYAFPPVQRASSLPPVVVGMGPAGLFAALFLARAGVPCILLERGQPVEQREKDIDAFWRGGALSETSNVQFGEGGAGTFSDGKLTTGTHDPRIATVLQTLVAAGAPEDILWQHKPHIGSDLLRGMVARIRTELRSLGCDIRFGHRLGGITLRGGALAGLTVMGSGGTYSLPVDTVVLATGHSARDTVQMLFDAGVPMQAKSFAIGVRIEHLQADISAAQYGAAWHRLPAADYKLACHLPNGRSAFTFCVCPGGQVVAAASEQGHLVTNGMSLRARDGTNCNGGFLVGVSPADFPTEHPLAGIAFQRQWERAAFQLGGSNYAAPVQRVEDFLKSRPSRRVGALTPTYLPGVTPCDLSGCLPSFVAETLRGALPLFGQKLKNFDRPDALLTGVETRSSSPVRILRDETLQSPVRGIYPCGEGAGYAGGIVSAAVDGIRVAEAIAGQA